MNAKQKSVFANVESSISITMNYSQIPYNEELIEARLNIFDDVLQGNKETAIHLAFNGYDKDTYRKAIEFITHHEKYQIISQNVDWEDNYSLMFNFEVKLKNNK